MDDTSRPALEEIDNRRGIWIAAINEGDPDAFVSVLAEDAVWLPVGQPAIAGKDRIRSWLQAPFARFSYDYSVADVRVRVAGGWAIESARFRTLAVTADGSAAPEHVGTYTLIWRLTDAGWLIERYIDHTAG